MRTDVVDTNPLPMSRFSATDFSAMELSRTHLPIQRSDIVRILTDYDRSASFELIALVNENYHAFLQAATGVRTVSSSALSCNGSRTSAYARAKKEFVELIRRSTNLKDDIHETRDARKDIKFLDAIIYRVQSLETTLQRSDCCLADLKLLTSEYERLHAEIEAIVSVLAEGARRPTQILQVTLNIVRDELARVRTEIIHKLIVELDRCCKTVPLSKNNNAASIYMCLCRLQAGSRMSQALKTILESSITFHSGSEDMASFLDDVRRKIFHSGSVWSELSNELGPIGLNVDEDVIKSVIEHELLRKSPVNGFIPTTSNLSMFYRNYSACCDFFGRKNRWEIISRFKTSIYVGLHLKRVTELVSGIVNDPQAVVGVVVTEILNRKDVCIEDENACTRIIQFVFDILAKIRLDIDHQTNDWSESLKRTDLMVNSLLPILKDNFHNIPFFSASVIDRLLAIESAIFKKLKFKSMMRVVDEASFAIIQTLESVKQVPALYRVATSRSAPTRHSVYVDLTMKAYAAWRDSAGPSAPLVSSQIVHKCISTYTHIVDDLLKARAGVDNKTKAQIQLDARKLYEFFQSTSEALQSLGGLKNLLDQLST